MLNQRFGRIGKVPPTNKKGGGNILTKFWIQGWGSPEIQLKLLRLKVSALYKYLCNATVAPPYQHADLMIGYPQHFARKYFEEESAWVKGDASDHN